MSRNAIKADGDSLRLQITKPARAAGLVEEQGSGDQKRTTYRADVYVHAFDGVLLVGDRDLDDQAWATVAGKATVYSESSYRCHEATIQHDGNGYSVALPTASDAGFELGDTPGVHPAPGLLVLTTDATAKLGMELANLRTDQTETRYSKS